MHVLLNKIIGSVNSDLLVEELELLQALTRSYAQCAPVSISQHAPVSPGELMPLSTGNHGSECQFIEWLGFSLKPRIKATGLP